MPGFSLEEPYPLATFKSTSSALVGQSFCVDALPVDTCAPAADSSEPDNAVESNLVAVTVQGEAIKLYNILDQNCIKSWSTPPSVVFNGPARILTKENDGNTDRYIYIAVTSGPDITSKEEGRVVWFWKDCDDTVPVDSTQEAGLKKTTRMFEDKIQAVHVSPAMQSYVVLVNENGSVSLVTTDLGRVVAKGEPAKSGGKIVWSTAITMPSVSGQASFIPTSMVPMASTLVATLTKYKDTYTFTILYINEERRSIDVLTNFDIQPENQPVSYSLQSQKGIFCLIDQDGTWTVYQIKLRHGPSNKVLSDVQKSISLPLNDLEIEKKSKTNLVEPCNTIAMTTLKDNYVAIVTGHKQTSEHQVSIWDVRYGTLQASTTIKNDSKSKDTKDTHIMYKITSLPNGSIAVTVSSLKRSGTTSKQSKGTVISSSAVYLINYYCSPMSLLAAMNTMQTTSQHLNIKHSKLGDGIGIIRSGHEAMNNSLSFEKQDPNQLYDDWVKNVDANQQTENSILAKLTKPDIKAAEFSKTFLAYAKEQQHQFANGEGSEEVDVVMTENGNVGGNTLANPVGSPKSVVESVTNLSYHFLVQVVSNCFKTKDNGKPDMGFWPVDVLEYLAVRGVLYSNFVQGGIVQAVMERESWELLEVVLKHVQDIPEGDLIKVVRTLANKDEGDWSDKFPTYFKLVLEAPRNDIFMQQAMKQLTTSELPIVLKTLRDWMDWWEQHGGGSSSVNSATEAVPGFVHIIDFTNVLLDVHFPTLILEESMHDLVKTLQDKVQEELEVCSDLEQLRGVLDLFHRKEQAREAAPANKARPSDAPHDELSKYRKELKGKFGGEQGVPQYRVEVFQF
ncbi:hypothetical protein INT43_000006 [Umbelopsis isabellina]|uniref:Uncharacterized protein n=1 Tax=Mortierella isabellina TaxID=91625 RepID=A0A8H7UAL9_MORIS|nr:hypothetical protein INT43_000006 [Umbelopsis isabellina]